MKKVIPLAITIALFFGSSNVSATELSLGLSNDIVSSELLFGNKDDTYRMMLDLTVQDNDNGETSGSSCFGALVGNSTFLPKSFTLSAGPVFCVSRESISDTTAYGASLFVKTEVPLYDAAKGKKGDRFFDNLAFEVEFKYSPSLLSDGDSDSGKIDDMTELYAGATINPADNVKLSIGYIDGDIGLENGSDVNVFSGLIFSGVMNF